jgi:signal transduction histidine kinase/CHASE2 domain-containing sensor protein
VFRVLFFVFLASLISGMRFAYRIPAPVQMNRKEDESILTSTYKSVIWYAAIVAVSSVLAMVVYWRVPGLELSGRDWLMRARGPLAVPDDIVIVAIDEPSIKRFGRFPWSRALMAQALDILRNAGPTAIALNVLYSEPVNRIDDSALAGAVAHAGNVVAAAQLVSDAADQDRTVWLRPLPEIENAAAAIGHANVHTGFDGVARVLLLRETDDEARPLWALAVELIRLGDGVGPEAVRQLPEAVMIGKREVPVTRDPGNLMIESGEVKVQTMLAPRLMIDYIGPSGSFAPQTVSFSDVIDGRVGHEKLGRKYVLIGATAATLGERVASPLIHTVQSQRPRSELMPGVEVLANQVNTILRGRFYRETPDWLAWFSAALISAVVILFAALAQGNYEIMRQVAALGGLLIFILIGSYLAFTKFFLLPPLVPMLIAFVAAVPLTLLRRSLLLSDEIDARIEELSRAGRSMSLPENHFSVNGSPGTATGYNRALSTQWLRGLRGASWKARELKALNQQLLQHEVFVDRALRAIEDGLIIATADAKIVFANSRAIRILGLPERVLIGGDLFERINEAESFSALQASSLVSRLQSAQSAREDLQQLLDDRRPIERELTIGSSAGNTRHYLLRVSTVSDSVDGAVCGIVAVLSDITRQRELQRTQRDVMALVTHELKTPITAIQGMSEVLAQFEVDSARQREMHLTINDEAKRLARMIDEYLDLTRLESGARRLRIAPLRIDQLLERSLLLLNPMAERRGISIIRKFPNDLPPLLGDADLITRAVTNLIDNAIKFSPADSTVTVSAHTDVQAMVIEVADEGHGISPEFLPSIFEKFYRVPRVTDADVPGTGLGLALVREVAELHGGRVSVESKPGAGSVFSLRLPIQKDEG